MARAQPIRIDRHNFSDRAYRALTALFSDLQAHLLPAIRDIRSQAVPDKALLPVFSLTDSVALGRWSVK